MARQRGGVFQIRAAMPKQPSISTPPCDVSAFRHGRDDNALDWQAQDEAVARSIGLETRGTADRSYWMRTYYRQPRDLSPRGVVDGAPAGASQLL